jgi:hypothetical protein
VIGGWRKLHNEELCDLYSSPSIIRIIKSRRMRWAGHVGRMGVKRKVCKLLVGRPEGKRLLERPRCRWVDDIRMDLGEVGWCGVHKMLGHYRVASHLVASRVVLSSLVREAGLCKVPEIQVN